MNTITPVTNIQSLQWAWRLVYRQYVDIKIIDENPYELWAFPHYFSEYARTWVGSVEENITCTISCVLDTENGLPLDSYYNVELNDLRQRGAKLAEIGLLADSNENTNPSTLLDLQRQALQFGLHAGHAEFVIGVHPRHVRYYRTLFGFEPIGEEKQYVHLNDAPVVLLHMSLLNERASNFHQNQIVKRSLIQCQSTLQQNTIPVKFSDNKLLRDFRAFYEHYIREKDHGRMSQNNSKQYLTNF